MSKNTRGATVTGQFGVVSSHGSVWDIAFSSDAAAALRVRRRRPRQEGASSCSATRCAEVGGFGSGGRYPGQFLAVGSIAADAQGNVYTGEQHHGKRVQKFVAEREPRDSTERDR